MRKFTLNLTIVLLLWEGATAFSQSVYRNVRISNLNAPEEPSIVVNPNNPRQMVAGANISSYYYSTNGGVNWFSGLLSSPYGVWGDPCVIVDTNNAYYFFHLSNPPNGSGSWLDRIVCQKLTAPGGVWSGGTYTGLNGTKAQDKEWAVVDRANNRIYVTWTQFDAYESSTPGYISIIECSVSDDGGQTWSMPVRINAVAGDCLDSDNTVEGSVPAVGPNGEIYVVWAGPIGIVLNKSLDGGVTWLPHELPVSDQPGGWDFLVGGIYRCNGLPIVACDLSPGPYRGNLYVNWSDQRNGPTDTDIWLVKSTDGGLTWSERKRVNDDPPGRQQFFTWMAIDQTDGAIYIVFYDRRNYTDSRTDVYLAVSRDGGETFTNTRISQTPFTPSASTFFGDYSNISAHNGVVRPIWTRLDSTSLSVWTALINSPPGIANLALASGSVQLSFTNLTSYLTNYVERSLDLGSTTWTNVATFTGVDGSTNWSETLDPGWGAAFYRIRAY